jgi:aminoglycoside phosphotransferase (APT) family kinase protein
MGIGKTVLVHGDATPTNFVFLSNGAVAAIDLEMMKRADPVFDLGMVCGEIKHAFLWRNSSTSMSEPFIEVFLRSYSAEAADPTTVFREITKRLPYFMGLTELRIARNRCLTVEYRRLLAREAIACLQDGIGRSC